MLDNVLIRVDVAEEKSAGGLFLSSVEPVLKNTGIVMDIGDSEVIKVSPGDRVMFEKGMGRRFEVPEKEEVLGVVFTRQVPYILIAYYDIVAILKE
jgi:co-chaperonin GroES (HSP10)